MIWKTANDVFRVELSSSVLVKMVELIEGAHDIETGGILVGKYIDENTKALVIDALPPPEDSLCKPCTFRRGSKGLSTLLKSLWNKRERLYYVGEWHYHPTEMVYPSQTDLDQMISISKDPNYECKEPIMVIIGKGVYEKREVKCLLFPKGITVVMLEA
ncbi:MAG: Mov34/MPN/PAD-1 family protein [Candidatus Cloacimonetes bacterium]|nr:Mov34/MPN/PAD-1 family protein [Candidatus Cloacimonadota bacterium]